MISWTFKTWLKQMWCGFFHGHPELRTFNGKCICARCEYQVSE